MFRKEMPNETLTHMVEDLRMCLRNRAQNKSSTIVFVTVARIPAASPAPGEATFSG
jgi:hypothetical protein